MRISNTCILELIIHSGHTLFFVMAFGLFVLNPVGQEGITLNLDGYLGFMVFFSTIFSYSTRRYFSRRYNCKQTKICSFWESLIISFAGLILTQWLFSIGLSDGLGLFISQIFTVLFFRKSFVFLNDRQSVVVVKSRQTAR